jgi:hypothetical protein
MLTQVSKSIQWSHQQQESNMDNLTIVVSGLAVFIIVLLIGEALAKFFDWK